MTQEIIEKSTSERLPEVLKELSIDQMRFVIARQEFKTDKEAAESIGLKPNTVYSWPDEVGEAVKLMAYDGIIMAHAIRRRSLAKAMMVKARGLDSGDERVRQGVATEIIEWEMGRAEQPVSVNQPLVIIRSDGNNTTSDSG